ncbi:MAG TPA: hypothetical protein VMU27_02420 [Candidatus Paceibacterota bacterium]|nr:hypothetical protein [Candidatus Paceibacterota bacterium]
MHNKTILFSWIATAIAALAVLGVVFFAFSILSTESQYATAQQQLSSASSAYAQAFNLHSELISSESDRTQLLSLLRIDPTTIAATINQVGSAAGVTLQIQSATAEATVTNNPTQAYDFSLTGHGTFAQMLYAEELLEALPIPSVIPSFQIIRDQPNPTSSDTQWQFNAMIKVVTTYSS